MRRQRAAQRSGHVHARAQRSNVLSSGRQRTGRSSGIYTHQLCRPRRRRTRPGARHQASCVQLGSACRALARAPAAPSQQHTAGARSTAGRPDLSRRAGARRARGELRSMLAASPHSTARHADKLRFSGRLAAARPYSFRGKRCRNGAARPAAVDRGGPINIGRIPRLRDRKVVVGQKTNAGGEIALMQPESRSKVRFGVRLSGDVHVRARKARLEARNHDKG